MTMGRRVVAVCVAVFSLPSAGAYAAALLQSGPVALVEEVVFGGESGPEEAVLFQVSDFDVDDAGNVYVSESKLHCIRKYDAAGALVATIGSEGEGPGDVRRPGALVVCRNGDVVVYEYGNHRVQRIAPDGEFVASLDFQSEMVVDLALGHGDALFGLVQVMAMGMPTGDTTLRLVRFSDAVDTTRTLDETAVRMSVVVKTDNGYMMTMAPYPPYPQWAPLRDGNVVVGRSDSNELRILSPDGSVVRTIAMTGERGRVTEAYRDAYWSRSMKDGKLMMSPDLAAAIEFKEWLPYYSGLDVDDAGHILVRWGVPLDDSATFMVYDAGGEFLSQFTIPELPSRVRFRGGKVYALRASVDELPTIVRYAME